MSSDTGSLKRKAGDDALPLQAPRRIKVIILISWHDTVLNRKLYRL